MISREEAKSKIYGDCKEEIKENEMLIDEIFDSVDPMFKELELYKSELKARDLELHDYIDKLEAIGTCGECRFYNDIRKCPMSCPDAMDESNYFYNFKRKQDDITE